MMSKLKNIWSVICYPLLYIGVQVAITMVFMIFFSIFVGVQLAAGRTSVNMTPEEITALVVSKIDVQIIILLTVPVVLLIMFLILKKEWKLTGFWRAEGIKTPKILLSLPIGAGMNLFTVGAINLIHLTELFPEHDELINVVINDNLPMTVVTVAVLVPFLEEVIFRGVVFSRLKRVTKLPAAIIIQAFIFGLIHLNVLQGIYAYMFGLVLALVYLWLDSIWAAAAAHIAFNLTSVIMSFLFGDAEIFTSTLILFTAAGLAAVVIGLVILARGRRRPGGEFIEVK